MNKSIRDQRSYTEGILLASGKPSEEYPLVIKVWWWNHTSPNNLRLSKSGIQYINKFTKIPVYECQLPTPLTNRNLVQLSRLFTCPYFIAKSDKVLLLGKEEATMLLLHAGNLSQYLDNLSLT